MVGFGIGSVFRFNKTNRATRIASTAGIPSPSAMPTMEGPFSADDGEDENVGDCVVDIVIAKDVGINVIGGDIISTKVVVEPATAEPVVVVVAAEDDPDCSLHRDIEICRRGTLKLGSLVIEPEEKEIRDSEVEIVEPNRPDKRSYIPIITEGTSMVAGYIIIYL